MRDGDEDSVTGNLYRFAMEKRESKKFMDEVRAFRVAPSGEKIIVRTGKDSFFATGTESVDDKKEIDLQGVAMAVDPVAEWRQIFNEGWRLMRDFVWDKEMSGLDWNGIRDKYAALLPRIATREDLNDLMGQMIGELATSHTYIWGGDHILKPEEIPTGLLGVDMVDDHGKYKIDRIYRGDPADAVPSPLLQPEVSARPDDYILAVNGKPIDAGRPFLAAFAKTAGRPILLTVSGTPAGPGRDVVVTPVANDAKLRYVDWVRRNRDYVAKNTDGKIAYLHLPDMSTSGLVAFSTWFYPQLDREGMIVDVRWNRGGFVSQMILERFRRHLLTFDDARWGGIYAYPYRTLNGPFVIITNQYAGSDGDVFPYAIQQEGLAPVIGKRSWGGVIGIRADKPLVDQGMITQPVYAMWDPKLGWSVENHGVDPDIEIEDLPQDIARGVDAQLDKAIEVVMKLREEHPPVKPAFGPKPKKNREAFQDELTAP